MPLTERFYHDVTAVMFLFLLRELKQKRKRHLKMQLRVSAIISQLIQVINLQNGLYVSWNSIENQRIRDKNTKLKRCGQVLTSSRRLQNRSFHDMERKSCERSKNEICTCKACKNTVL